MRRLPLLFLCAALMAAAIPSRAIELSLEENRAERGNMGFVDMQRLFKASPDASRAREGLEELVRQAEEHVNTRKAELLRLRQDLGALKIEREELAKSTPTLSAPVPAPVTLNLPGMMEGPLDLGRPGTSPLNPTRDHSIPKRNPRRSPSQHGPSQHRRPPPSNPPRDPHSPNASSNSTAASSPNKLSATACRANSTVSAWALSALCSTPKAARPTRSSPASTVRSPRSPNARA